MRAICGLATAALTVAFLLGTVFIAGCGSSGSDSSSTEAATAPATYPTAPGGKAEKEAPEGASATLRALYRQFPKPTPNPEVKGSAKAIRAGEAACKGKTPSQVKAAFYSAAIEEGNLKAGSPEAKMIAKLPSYEAKAPQDSAFVAGQLAADTYQATLPEAVAQFGYQGCVYSLALRLKRELAPK
jgi:hypothetical protein